MLHFNDSIKSLNKKINLDLKFLWHWLNANKIALNTSKTEFIIFKHPSKHLDCEVKLSIGGKKIYPSSSTKYLGIILDADMGWKSQINMVASKLKRANGILAKLRHMLPKEVLLTLYFALFYSHINNCSQIWGQDTNTNINRISALQNWAVRLISFADLTTPSNRLYSELGLLKFRDF